MIPKVGDKVIVNPKFKEAYFRAYPAHKTKATESENYFGGEKEGYVKVTAVKKAGIYLEVHFVGGAYLIDPRTGAPRSFDKLLQFGLGRDEPLFLPFTGSVVQTEVTTSNHGVFCNCSDPVLVESSTTFGGRERSHFMYCRRCKNERL